MIHLYILRKKETFEQKSNMMWKLSKMLTFLIFSKYLLNRKAKKLLLLYNYTPGFPRFLMARKERREMLLASPLEALKKTFLFSLEVFPPKVLTSFK